MTIVLKYNMNHDDLGRFSASTSGGNGLTHRESVRMQSGRTDYLKKKVYDAEENFQPSQQHEWPKPSAPVRSKFATGEEYSKAYREYSKKFTEYARESQRNIQSDLGKQHLDGTAMGVRRYIVDITGSSWFQQAFGNGGVFGTPMVALSDTKIAGKYAMGLKNGSPFSKMYIDKTLSVNETVILHELAHYATTISQPAQYDSHGIEFVRNHLFIASHVIGHDYAVGLEKAYRKEGIPLGN